MNHLVVFARWPEPGRVKTRLSPALPPDLACALHEAMLRDVLEAGRGSSAERRYLYWTDAPADRAWSTAAREAGFVESLQHGGDLGARLETAFDDLLSKPDQRAVIVGSDCPDLSSAAIDEAFRRLEGYDVVLGPTRDGGYYLVGLRRPAPDLFRDIPWGSQEVFAVTLGRARHAEFAVTRLEPMDDIDTPEDLIRLVSRRLASETPTPRHTVAALERIGLLPAPRP